MRGLLYSLAQNPLRQSLFRASVPPRRSWGFARLWKMARTPSRQRSSIPTNCPVDFRSEVAQDGVGGGVDVKGGVTRSRSGSAGESSRPERYPNRWNSPRA
jgi:hypothetical protein